MSRRQIKKSTINDLGQVVPEVMAVVTSRDDVQVFDRGQNFFKRNYSEAIRKIIPKFYFSDEQEVSGDHVSFTNQLINSHILANKNQSEILPVSSLVHDEELSSLNSPEGFAKYFYKTQHPAQINADDFQRNILDPLNVKLSDYATSEAFVEYVSGTLLPSIPLVHAGAHATDNLATLTASAFANDSSGTYKYLANNLGWVYFLNRTGPSPSSGKPTPFDPSTALPELLTNTIWKGRSIVLQDTLSLYQEYLWKNQPTFTTPDRIIPESYVSSIDKDTGVYTSGTQVVDRLKTLIDIVYSPHFMDSTDSKVESAFTTFFDTSSVTQEGTLITDKEEAGPLKRFIDAISFAIADRVTEQSEIDVLYDIGKCPEEFLELLGELIGWQFIGNDIDKWRVQLRSAVEIYKSKGTRRSIQFLLDALFSTGVFTPSNDIKELWESYIPDLIYYALATSSAVVKDFETYTPEIAEQFGVRTYNNEDFNTNIKLLVDKILFDLVLEFPDSFYLGGKPFPGPQLAFLDPLSPGDLLLDVNGNPALLREVELPGLGYRIERGSDGEIKYFLQLPEGVLGEGLPPIGGVVEPANDLELKLLFDENFVFQYRGAIQFIPPYEKKQYYMPTKLSSGMIDKINFFLTCFGVDKNFANQVTDFIKVNTVETKDTDSVINSFLFFTKEKQYPPNQDAILKQVTQERTPDPASLLSLWNGKSSHFILNFDSSSFDFDSSQRSSTTKYALTKVIRVLNQVIPAHAIPEVLLSVSSFEDALDAIADNDCREVRPNFTNLYEGSSTVTTGWATCAIDMADIAVQVGLQPNRFKRTDVDNINDTLVSGTGTEFVARGAAMRNSLRRRSFKNLLPDPKLFTRLGKNNPGSLELSSPFYSSAIGFLPLGFIPSSQQFQEVSLETNTLSRDIGEILGDLHPVWEICNNRRSNKSFFGYDISNTFASRAKQDVATSDCNTYGRRGQLPEIMYMMTRVNDLERFLQASSLVSGCFDPETGVSNTAWPTGSELLSPSSFETWFNHFGQNLTGERMTDTVIQSIANYLVNKDSADISLNRYEHFTFGRKVHELYNDYAASTLFNGHGTTNNYNLLGVPNIFSHAFGPLVYNSALEIDGSGLEASGFLSASSTLKEVDLGFAEGSGVLSISGTSGSVHEVGTVAASDSTDLFLGAPEFRNKHLVSSIEIIDTSSPTSVVTGPIFPTFSLFRLTRDEQTKFSFAKYLINNQIIKYQRGPNQSTLPRVRVVIDPSDTTQAKNFLQPNHEYEITLKAHNLPIEGTTCNGQSIGCWIHTLDEGYGHTWTFNPQTIFDECGLEFDRWEKVDDTFLNSIKGIPYVQNKVQLRPFAPTELDRQIGSGVGVAADPVTLTYYDVKCFEPVPVETIVGGSNPLAIANVNKATLQELKFKFTTNNDFGVDTPTNDYKAQKGQVHRTDQKYAIEFFIRDGNLDQFVVIEEISIQDLTSYNKAVIQTQFGEAQLTVKDFKAVCRYFRDLSTGIASRNPVHTSGVMEASGGSRLNYRSISNMFDTTQHATNNQLTEVRIHEG